jgi:hypothetical protein
MPRRIRKDKRRRSTRHIFPDDIRGSVVCGKPECQAVWHTGTSKPKSHCPDTSGKYSG